MIRIPNTHILVVSNFSPFKYHFYSFVHVKVLCVFKALCVSLLGIYTLHSFQGMSNKPLLSKIKKVPELFHKNEYLISFKCGHFH